MELDKAIRQLVPPLEPIPKLFQVFVCSNMRVGQGIVASSPFPLLWLPQWLTDDEIGQLLIQAEDTPCFLADECIAVRILDHSWRRELS